MEKITISGMGCQHCVASVKEALEKISGLSNVKVNLDDGNAQFENNGADRRIIRDAISAIGFEPGE